LLFIVVPSAAAYQEKVANINYSSFRDGYCGNTSAREVCTAAEGSIQTLLVSRKPEALQCSFLCRLQGGKSVELQV